MSTKLYVGNLAYTTMEDDLRQIFEGAGSVASCEVVLDKFTKKSRGFAFIEMSSQEEATLAVEKFNEHELDGRRLVVNEARPREARPGGGRGGYGGGGGYAGGGGGGAGGGYAGGGGGGGGYGGKRKSGKGSRRNSRSAKRERKAY
jgi:RNA recognition motif-containing protein